MLICFPQLSDSENFAVWGSTGELHGLAVRICSILINNRNLRVMSTSDTFGNLKPCFEMGAQSFESAPVFLVLTQPVAPWLPAGFLRIYSFRVPACDSWSWGTSLLCSKGKQRTAPRASLW